MRRTARIKDKMILARIQRDVERAIELSKKINTMLNSDDKTPATIKMAALELACSDILDNGFEPGATATAITIHKEARKRWPKK